MTTLLPQGLPTNAPPSPPVPSIGDIVYLASALFRVRVGAQSTPPDTPNQYTADLGIMGDQGQMNRDAIRGHTGDPGLQTFAFRRQDDADVNGPEDLPNNLTDTQTDIGKYWLIDTLDFEGQVTTETAWTWYGTEWRTFTMGTYGPPGPVPEISVEVVVIPEDQDAHVDGGGGTLQPSWTLYEPQPAGIPGPVGPMYLFPDTDVNSPATYDAMAFLGNYNEFGQPIFEQFSIEAYLPQPYSMPEGSFSAFSGVTQRAAIGSYAIPPQPFDWTPIVWGHLGGPLPSAPAALNAIQSVVVSALSGTFQLLVGSTPTAPIPYDATPNVIQSAINAVIGAGNSLVTAAEQDFSHLVEFVGSLAGTAVSTLTADVSNLLPAGVASVLVGVEQVGGALGALVGDMLSGSPLMIGGEVLLGDPVTGTQVARGIGSLVGRVIIDPHFSTSAKKTQALTPTNNYAVVPKNHTDPAQGTLYVNLWNDGALGVYNFQPTNAQLYIQVMPTDLMAQFAAGRRRGR